VKHIFLYIIKQSASFIVVEASSIGLEGGEYASEGARFASLLDGEDQPVLLIPVGGILFQILQSKIDFTYFRQQEKICKIKSYVKLNLV